MSRPRRWWRADAPQRRTILLVVGVLGTGVVGASAASGAGGGPTDRFTAKPVAVGGVVDGVKSRTARIAESDPALVGRTDDAPVNVVVKLDYDSVAAYDGGVAGLAPTSPSVTGKKLDANPAAVGAYERHVAAEERAIVSDIEQAVPAATVRASFRVVYGGISMTLPANQVRKVLSVDGVVAVQRDTLEHPLTDVTPQFLGATNVYPQLGGRDRAGQGVVVGVLDTGITPQHPSFRDSGLPAPPGGPFTCDFGDGSDPELGPTAGCNNKLIGARPFLSAYLSVFDAEPGEFCDNATGRCSARDADGHGTHTASTAAGDYVQSAKIFGIERGPLNGIAPGAYVMAYRVCLEQGCFESDAVAAIQQAILDGVDIINFSIGGGSEPFTDPVELAFLDFYKAGGLANASAGNSGPDAGTAEHGGPWVNTVGASTSPRHFLSALMLRSADGARTSITGATITPGLENKPVVTSESIGGDKLCTKELPAGAAAGKVVVCQRGPNRNAKARVVQRGGGLGMILYNPTKMNLFTDNFWVPTIMLEGPLVEGRPAPSTSLLAFLAQHGNVTATWRTGEPRAVRADEMTTFSSRGPVGDFIKPDVTAPGLQILAGNTPTPWGADASGPPGELFQVIAGTSMSSPHAAGVSALVKAAHPDWTPGQIKSALMTSSVQSVVKPDGRTPADPFDRGAGSIRADRAVAAPITFDVSAEDYIEAVTAVPLHRVDLNVPSIDATTMPGEIETTRTMKNVTGRRLVLDASAQAPPGSAIVVTPRRTVLAPNQSKTVTIAILGKDLEQGKQYFGQVTFHPDGHGLPDAVLPVAFFTKQGDISLTHACAASSIAVGETAHCEVTAQNKSVADAHVAITLTGGNPRRLDVRNVTPPAVQTRDGFRWSGTLDRSAAPQLTSITPGGSPAGFVPLSQFGIAPIADAGDETLVNVTVPRFKFGSEEYTKLAMTSDGYAIVDGGDSTDLDVVPQTFPDPARPNNVLAPYWTDLDPGAGGSMSIGEVTDGVNAWIVMEWKAVPLFGQPTDTQSFQIWIQEGDTESVTYAYGPVTGHAAAGGVNAGAENRDGSSGVNISPFPVTDSDYTVGTSPPVPGAKLVIGYDAQARHEGLFQLVARLSSDITLGNTTETVDLRVTGK
jgi:subtilisin family serine protease